MSNHPINLGVRFLLELSILASLGYWGWTEHNGIWRFLWGVGLPLAAAAVWGTFRVPNDPGPAPVAVPGLVRLLLELALFGAAVALLFAAGQRVAGGVLATLVILHYGVSYDRVFWLLRQ
jgi:hypothetical protein